MSLPPLPPALRVVVLPASDEGPLTTLPFQPKDPDETVDYGIDATAFLATSGDTFAQAECTILPNDLIATSTTWDDTHIVMRLTAGSAFTNYTISVIGVLVSGEHVKWVAQLACGTSGIFTQNAQGSVFSTNGFGLTYAGQTITNGGG